MALWDGEQGEGEQAATGRKGILQEKLCKVGCVSESTSQHFCGWTPGLIASGIRISPLVPAAFCGIYRDPCPCALQLPRESQRSCCLWYKMQLAAGCPGASLGGNRSMLVKLAVVVDLRIISLDFLIERLLLGVAVRSVMAVTSGTCLKTQR